MANILLVDEAVTRVSKQAIEAMGHVCYYAEDPNQAEASLRSRPFDVFVSEIHNKNDNFRLFDLAQELQSKCRCIAIIPDSLEEYFPDLLVRAYPHNFLADNRPIDVKELVITIRKLLSKNIFGIEKYEIFPEETMELHTSSEKYPVIERVREYYLKRGVSERIVRNVELILNELLMNAMFDAPVSPDGKRLYGHLDRSTNFEFKEGERPHLSYGMGETHLALSICDPFGNLDRETFLSYVHRCFAEKSILEEIGKGAGMGLFLVFKSLDQMVINVNAGRQTEVIALIDHRSSLGELKKRQHSFHYFQIDDSQGGAERPPA